MSLDLTQTIKSLELKLLAPEVRQSLEALSTLLHDDFVEFGSSGRIYSKQDILDHLPSSPVSIFFIENFSVECLSKYVVLAQYISYEQKNPERILRSSIWKKSNNDWQIIFHQGTPTNIKT